MEIVILGGDADTCGFAAKLVETKDRFVALFRSNRGVEHIRAGLSSLMVVVAGSYSWIWCDNFFVEVE